MREIRVSDATMKRAAQTKALTLSFKEKLELAKLLERLSVSVIEVEGIEKAKVDSLRIKSIASLVSNSVLAVPVKLDDPENVAAVWNAVKAAPKARLQVQASVSPAQMQYIYCKKAPAMKEAVAAAVAECAKYASDVEFVAEDATRADAAFLREVVAAAIEAGATVVSINDDAGKMLPEEFARFVASLKEDVPALANVALGVSCSDALYMADACTIAAIMAGADEVKTTSFPLDTASTDRVAAILAGKADVAQASCGVRLTEVKRVMGRSAGSARASATRARS